MDLFDVTLNYWAMRGRTAKGLVERSHAKNVHHIFKSHGRERLKDAHKLLASLRDTHAKEGSVTQFTYSQAADEALRLLSVIEGTPKRNLAKKKRRCGKYRRS